MEALSEISGEIMFVVEYGQKLIFSEKCVMRAFTLQFSIFHVVVLPPTNMDE